MYAILNDSWKRQVTEKHLRKGLQFRESADFVHRNYAQQQLSLSKISLIGNVCGLTATILDPFSNKYSLIGKDMSTAMEMVSFCYNIYSSHAECKHKRSLKEWTLDMKTHIGHLKECLETLERGRGCPVNINDNGNSMQRNDLVPQYAQNIMAYVIKMISPSLHVKHEYLQNIQNKKNKIAITMASSEAIRIVTEAGKALQTARDSFLSVTEDMSFIDQAANAMQNTAKAVLSLRDGIEAIREHIKSSFWDKVPFITTGQATVDKMKQNSVYLIGNAEISGVKIKEMKDDVDKVNRMLCSAEKAVKTFNQNPEIATEIAVVLLRQTEKSIEETKDVISKLQNGVILLKQNAQEQVRGAKNILKEVRSIHQLPGIRDINFKIVDDQRKKVSQALEGTQQIADDTKLELKTKEANASIEDACRQIRGKKTALESERKRILKLKLNLSNTSLKEKRSLKEKALAINKLELVFNVLSILVNIWKIKTNNNTLKKRHVLEGAISCSCNRSVDLVRESMPYNQRITKIIKNDGDIIIWSFLLFGRF